MPRSNRPRGRRPDDDEDSGFNYLVAGWRRTEMRGGYEWNVQPINGARSTKTYVCPGCRNDIGPGVSHLVAWRADGPLGDAADLASRRHWHSRCWTIG